MAGQAIDINRQTTVFDGGEVGIVETLEEKEVEDEQQGTRGSAAGSRPGPEAGSRTAGEAARLGLGNEPDLQLELTGLQNAYPTIIKRGDHGLWIIVTSKPLGLDGPQVFFLVGYPDRRDIPPKAWAFWKLGDFPKFVGPRHTNFPDASIRAFGPEDGAWVRTDGVLALVDLYSTWAFRQLFLFEFGTWPGRQHGASALYRRTEFSSSEWCSCDSGLRYGECHEESDRQMADDDAHAEHRAKLGSNYRPRHPPKSVMRFARSRWTKLPPFKTALENG